MRFAGIDIGSRSIELIVLQDNEVVIKKQSDTGFDPMSRAEALLDDIRYDGIIATGYGRNLFEISFDAPTVTEIKAYAIGANVLFPGCKTVLDIGGQDIKVISVNGQGKVIKFEMNDKCAAGTGMFLEIMAQTLGYDLDEFGKESLSATKVIVVSSMCTVFAESEIISLMAKGENRRDIALGIHHSIVRQTIGMLKRTALNGLIVFAGGVAKNICIQSLFRETFGRGIQIPENPEFVGALGAAILTSELF